VLRRGRPHQTRLLLISRLKVRFLPRSPLSLKSIRYKESNPSGAWKKMRVNKGQEFVVGGYTPAGRYRPAALPKHVAKGRCEARLHQSGFAALGRKATGQLEARTIREMPKRRRFRLGSIPILGLAETGSNYIARVYHHVAQRRAIQGTPCVHTNPFGSTGCQPRFPAP
jgi:hypothetical protein